MHSPLYSVKGPQSPTVPPPQWQRIPIDTEVNTTCNMLHGLRMIHARPAHSRAQRSPSRTNTRQRCTHRDLSTPHQLPTQGSAPPPRTGRRRNPHRTSKQAVICSTRRRVRVRTRRGRYTRLDKRRRTMRLCSLACTCRLRLARRLPRLPRCTCHDQSSRSRTLLGGADSRRRYDPCGRGTLVLRALPRGRHSMWECQSQGHAGGPQCTRRLRSNLEGTGRAAPSNLSRRNLVRRRTRWEKKRKRWRRQERASACRRLRCALPPLPRAATQTRPRKRQRHERRRRRADCGASVRAEARNARGQSTPTDRRAAVATGHGRQSRAHRPQWSRGRHARARRMHGP
jgi:hypothetical protein